MHALGSRGLAFSSQRKGEGAPPPPPPTVQPKLRKGGVLFCPELV